MLMYCRFGYQRSTFSGTHSSGVVSVAFSNLPNHKRYRPHNLKIAAMTPGPKEFNADELQYALKDLVDELIKLYEKGIFVRTPCFPEGTLENQPE